MSIISEVLYGLALLELHKARELAWKIVEAPTLDCHVSIGLSLGKAGRRMQRLTEELDCLDLLTVALSDDEFVDAPELHYAYFAAKALIQQLGIQGQSYKYTLCQCESLLTDSPPLEETEADICVDWLCAVGRGRPRRSRLPPVKGRIGNPKQKFDPRFRTLPIGSVLSRVRRIETKEGLLQKLHHTVFRETLAAELAALNLYEYDNLPWRFYVDMCRQVEDESRHASMAYEMLIKRGGSLSDYPVSYLGNFYLMNLSMSLDERLVAMNLDTEALGQFHLRDMSKRLRSIGDEESAAMFEAVETDETRHAVIGARWFRYLIPGKGERKSTLEQARIFAIAHLAVSHCEITGEASASDVIQRWIGGQRSFALEDFDPKIHESEVSLTTASDRSFVFVD